MQSKDHEAESPKPGILVLSIDFDGCTDTNAARDKLIGHIALHCHMNPNFTEVIVAIGSLRQSVYSDFNNAARHKKHTQGRYLSCAVLLTDFVKKLAIELAKVNRDIKVKRVKMLNCDIFNNLEFGTTFDCMNSKNYDDLYSDANFRTVPIDTTYGDDVSYLADDDFENWYEENLSRLDDDDEKSEFLADWSFSIEEFEDYLDWRKLRSQEVWSVKDKSNRELSLLEFTGVYSYQSGSAFHFDDVYKCLTLYILYHYLAVKVDKPFEVWHLDDRQDILHEMSVFYEKHSYLIPSGCSLKGVEWTSHRAFNVMDTTPWKTIQGVGHVNHNYAEDATGIAKACDKDKACVLNYLPLIYSKQQAEQTPDSKQASEDMHVASSVRLFATKSFAKDIQAAASGLNVRV